MVPYTYVYMTQSINDLLDATQLIILVFTQCYKVVSGKDTKNWQDARSYCMNQGGNLVSILNYREQGKFVICFLCSFLLEFV